MVTTAQPTPSPRSSYTALRHPTPPCPRSPLRRRCSHSLTARRRQRRRGPLRHVPKLAPNWSVGSWRWFRWFVQGPSKFDSPCTNF